MCLVGLGNRYQVTHTVPVPTVLVFCVCVWTGCACLCVCADLDHDGTGSVSFTTLTLTAPLYTFILHTCAHAHKHITAHTPRVFSPRVHGVMLLEKNSVPPAVGCIYQLDGLGQH